MMILVRPVTPEWHAPRPGWLRSDDSQMCQSRKLIDLSLDSVGERTRDAADRDGLATRAPTSDEIDVHTAIA